MSRTATAETSLADTAHHAIREMIVSLELRPGSLISERALMERLRLGRTPTREALQRLAQERLVEVYPRRGMFVASVEIRDLAAISEVRAELESHAARLAAERATEDELAEVERLAGDLGTRTDVDERDLMEMDERVHRHVYRCAHNRYLARTLEEYYVLSLRIWHLTLDRPRELRIAVFEHQAMLEAIAERDGAVAANLMRGHVRDFERAMRRLLVGGA
jgi:DNA-binding GntR family transcriptional regulator